MDKVVISLQQGRDVIQLGGITIVSKLEQNGIEVTIEAAEESLSKIFTYLFTLTNSITLCETCVTAFFPIKPSRPVTIGHHTHQVPVNMVDAQNVVRENLINLLRELVPELTDIYFPTTKAAAVWTSK